MISGWAGNKVSVDIVNTGNMLGCNADRRILQQSSKDRDKSLSAKGGRGNSVGPAHTDDIIAQEQKDWQPRKPAWTKGFTSSRCIKFPHASKDCSILEDDNDELKRINVNPVGVLETQIDELEDGW